MLLARNSFEVFFQFKQRSIFSGALFWKPFQYKRGMVYPAYHWGVTAVHGERSKVPCSLQYRLDAAI